MKIRLLVFTYTYNFFLNQSYQDFIISDEMLMEYHKIKTDGIRYYVLPYSTVIFIWGKAFKFSKDPISSMKKLF